MRAFVAVFPPPGIRQAVLEAARRGIPADRVRWTRHENLHLTLKFLGDVPEGRVDAIATALRSLAADHTPFEASFKGFGAFPSSRRARIVWASVGAGAEEVRALAADVDAALEPLGFGREGRPYVPHATLGRIRGRPASLELPAAVPGEPRFGVSRVELVESTLGTGGPAYETLRSVALRPG